MTTPPAEAAPVIVVSGTAPGPGRVLVLAAVAAGLREEELEVLALTVVRTGAEPDGLLRVDDLVAIPTVDLVRLDIRLPPLAAAREARTALPGVVDQATQIAVLTRDPDVDLLLLDDTEGLLTPLDDDGASLLDLLDLLDGQGLRVGIVLACVCARDAVDAICLRAQALTARDVDILGVVGAAWPPEEDDLAVALERDIPRASGLPWLGAVPASAAAWTREEFTARAGSWVPLT